MSLLVVSCTSGSDVDPQAEPVDADRSIARSVEADATSSDASSSDVRSAEPSVLDDESLNPEGIINAAVLLHSGGDVDAALRAGAFTRDELDAARDGLADGSLDHLFE